MSCTSTVPRVFCNDASPFLFFLVYSAEAILPTDLEYGSPRLKAYQVQQNQQAREDSLDQVDEARDVALLHSARYQ